MKQRTYFLISGIVFGVVSLFHLLRLWLRWGVLIGGCQIPSWLSVAGLLIAGALSLMAFGLLRRSP